MLVLFIGLISVMFVAAAISIDYSKWLSERQGIARAADLGALAATQDMPADPVCSGAVDPCFESLASCNAPAEAPPPTIPPPPGWVRGDPCKAAFEWAKRNGYEDGKNGVEVRVTFLCGNDMPTAVRNAINAPNMSAYPQHMCHNGACSAPAPPGIPDPATDCGFPYLSNCPDEAGEKGCDAIRVAIQKPGAELFSTFFGGAGVDVGFTSYGSITFKLLPTDSAIAIDASGSMNESCGGGCTKIQQARIAAKTFVNQLTNGTGITRLGYAPYTGCYTPPGPGPVPPQPVQKAPVDCIPTLPNNNLNDPSECDKPGRLVTCLNKQTPNTVMQIGNTIAEGSTNVCLGLKELWKILDGANNQKADADTKQFAVLLTDGDNEYAVNTAPGLDPDCAPAPPTAGADICNGARSAGNRSLDIKTVGAGGPTAKLKAAGVEIFTIQIYASSCIPPNVVYTAPQCDTQVGNGDPPRIAAARLLQCVASSTPGTNDHYFKTQNAADLVNIFTTVAYEISSRGLTVVGPQ